MNQINSKKDFLIFLRELIIQLKDNPEKFGENNTLEAYLEGMEGWVEDMDGYYENNNLGHVDLKNVNWRVFADVLMAASIYE